MLRSRLPGWALAITTGCATVLLLQVVVHSAQHIPVSDPSWDYMIGVLWALVLGVSILAWPIDRRTRQAVLAMWLIRTGVCLVAMLPYEANYATLDGYTYFGASVSNGFDASQISFGSGTNNILQLSALQHLFLPESYHALKISYAFAGLIAVYYLYRAARLLLGRDDLRVFFLLGLFPSVLFWSSILGKEPLILLFTAIYIYGVVGWFVEKRISHLVLICAGIVLAGFIRIWSMPIMLVPLVIPMMSGVHGKFRKSVLLVAVLAVALVGVQFVAGRFRIASTADLLASTELWSQAWAVGGSARTISVDLGSLSGIMSFLPRGMFAALFRPLPGEIMNPFALLAGAENLLLLGMLAVAIVRMRIRDLMHPVALWAVTLLIVWSGVYGIFSYQNLGTAARFKVQILPVLLGLLAYGVRPRWLFRTETHDAT